MFSHNIYTLSKDSFQPTYLYIKQHSVTGKLYFGKTIQRPEKYFGSGKHWLRHLKAHGRKYVVTLWYCLYYDEAECIKMATMFSAQQNIVESKEWLNLKLETGIDGTVPGTRRTIESRMKQSKARKGKPSGNKGNPAWNKGLVGYWSGKTGPRKGMVPWNKGIPHSEKTKQKMSELATGRPSPLKGIPKSEESKRHLSKIMTGRPSPKKGIPLKKYPCPYCNKPMSRTNLVRWHGDKCKSRPKHV